MAISSATSKAGPYAGNDTQTAFPFAFYTLAASDIKVISTVMVNGVGSDTALILGTDYTVALNADQTASPGGTVTILAAPPVGISITILRNMVATQPAQFPNNGGFYPEVLERALDKLTMIVQQLFEQVNRAVIFSPGGSIVTPGDIAVQAAGAAESAATAVASAAVAVSGAAFDDANPIAKNHTDQTKRARLSLGGLTTGVTRVITLPDEDLTLAGRGRNTYTDAQNGAPPASIASAATVGIGAAASNEITITGTTPVTAFDNIAAGATREVTFSGALTLTHNGTSLILPGGANITTAAGDVANFVSLGSGNWRCTSYMRANGQAIVTPQALVLLAVLTPTAAANLDALNVFSSTYDNYLILGQGILPSADDSLNFRLANGGVVDSASNYFQVGPNSTGNSALTKGPLVTNCFAAGDGCGFTMLVSNVNDSVRLKRVKAEAIGQSALAPPTFVSTNYEYPYTAFATVSGFRLYWQTSSNFAATGKVFVYGYQKS